MGVLVAKQAPNFKANAVMPDGSFKEISLEEYRGKYVVLFFYPLNFTFVCPTEIITLDKNLGEFTKLSAEVMSISVDSIYSHYTWRKLSYDKGGISNVGYPMVSDISKSISEAYGVLHPDGVAFRAVFIIDKKGIVRSQIVNDLPLGRNIHEIIRTLSALKHFETHGEVCPADWSKGEEAFKPNLDDTISYLKNKA